MTDDESFQCVYQCQDEANNKGVKLDRNIVRVAGRALEKQFTQLGPNILPFTELIKFFSSHTYDKLTRSFLHPWFPDYFPPRQKVYKPDFKRSIDHFCIHAGGRAVIEGIQKNLNLTEKDVAPSFYALKNWGNTSRVVEILEIGTEKSCGASGGSGFGVFVCAVSAVSSIFGTWLPG